MRALISGVYSFLEGSSGVFATRIRYPEWFRQPYCGLVIAADLEFAL